MLDYATVRNWQSAEIRHAYTPKDVMLYALGVGMAQDPLDREELRYVTEDHLRVLPSMAAVLAGPGFWIRNNPEVGIDYVRLVHGEQSVTLLEPLPAGGTLLGSTRVTRVVDKGVGKGALVHSEKTLIDAASGALVATSESVTFCRADGGFSANGGGDAPGPAPKATPETLPELTLNFQTRPEAALIEPRHEALADARVSHPAWSEGDEYPRVSGVHERVSPALRRGRDLPIRESDIVRRGHGERPGKR